MVGSCGGDWEAEVRRESWELEEESQVGLVRIGVETQQIKIYCKKNPSFTDVVFCLECGGRPSVVWAAVESIFWSSFLLL